MKTSSCKAKGRRCASEVRDALLRWAPDLRPDDIGITSSGVTGEDVTLSPAARDIYPFTIECKCVEKLNIWAALEQAEAHAKGREHLTPLVAFKRNRSKLYVAIELERFLRLIGQGTL